MPQSDPSGCDDAELVRRILAGEHDLYRQVVVKYENRLIAYLAHMLGDYELARDVAQETFVAAFEALDQWRGTRATALAPWLYRIATNRALNALRAQKSRGGVLPSLITLVDRPTSGCSLEDRFVQRELLTSALRKLSAEDAACLVLHVVSGERYAEIGMQLDLTGEAVRKRVARGLVALRTAYHALDVEVQR